MLRFLTAGESHGSALIAILEGMPAGLELSPADFEKDLARRQQGYGSGPRMKLEADAAEIIAGVMEGKTTGAPIALRIRNRDHANWKGKAVDPMTIPRPGHADLTAAAKYGYRDLRYSLERASARETASRVAVGSICRKLLTQFDLRVGSYVIQIGKARAEFRNLDLKTRFENSEMNSLRCPDEQSFQKMETEIRQAIVAKDTLGGIFEVIASNVPIGLGSHVHWDRRLSTELAAALMSIPAIKGIEIGDGFGYADQRGSEAHDAILLSDGELARPTNHAGGLEGGITNGQPIILRAVMKPLSTTLQPQRSVNLAEGIAAETEYERSDFCAVPRAAIVAEAMVAFVIARALLRKLGGDSLTEIRSRFNLSTKPKLSEFDLHDEASTFWE
ncbi:MAG: chorismate synthase [Anaerolineales bacterium]|nr:chorismate synthase [Anaerolineales bacterium]